MRMRLMGVAMCFLAGALALAVGCKSAKQPSDSALTTSVQKELAADTAVVNKQINVQSDGGVVTLSGNVGSDQERTAAASDAALVQGVRNVVNNLQVQPSAAQARSAGPPPVPGAEQTANGEQVWNPDKPSPRHDSGSQQMSSAQQVNEPRIGKVTLRAGTRLEVRLADSLDSGRNRPGDLFHASLDSPMVVGGKVVIPAGAEIEGRVVQAKSAGHFKGRSVLALQLTSLRVNGESYPLHSTEWEHWGASRGKSTARRVGGGAIIGTIIGAFAGGGKGAAIGAGVGSAAGGGVQAATNPQEVHLGSESRVSFRLASPITVTPQSTLNRGGNQLANK